MYDAMERVIEGASLTDIPTVIPFLGGTRKDPLCKGAIEGLSTENFTPQHLIVGMMEGIARELYEMYQSHLKSGGDTVFLYGSGNGLRKNQYLQSCFEQIFCQNLVLCSAPEEAALGAAMFVSERGLRNEMCGSITDDF